MSSTLPEGYLLNSEYSIINILGQGGFGITYLAKDLNLGHQVVIKEFLPQSIASREQSHYSVSPNMGDGEIYIHLLKRFIEEAQLLAKTSHPNIVQVTRLLESNNTAYFIMVYEEGETLEDYLLVHPTLTQEQILAIMMPILEGTKYIHSRDLLHRDIAPDNIYLKTNGMPILIDFGAARSVANDDPKSAIIKDGYSPPEQHTTSSNQTVATDIYALGAVMYRMITGRKPPSAILRQTDMISKKPDSINSLAIEYKDRYTQPFLKAVIKALDTRQEYRFQTVEAFQEKLSRGMSPAPKKVKWIPIVAFSIVIGSAILLYISMQHDQEVSVETTTLVKEQPPTPIEVPISVVKPVSAPIPEPHIDVQIDTNTNAMMEAIGGLSDE